MRAAVVISLGVIAALSGLAFWPARGWTPPPRPVLHGPIVFDEFVAQPTPSAEPATAQEPVTR
jgi:hypothetical protein